jgi:large repetitive protein
MSRVRLAHWALLLLVGVAACGKNPIISIEIVTPTGEDTFAGATKLRVTNATPAATNEIPLTSGATISLELDGVKAEGDTTTISIDALDDAGVILAHGATPAFGMTASEAYLRVYVGRTGAFGEAPGALTAGRTEIALASFSGLGALIVGGSDAGGTPLATTTVYNEYLHQVADAADLGVARAGLTALEASDTVVVAFAGRTATGVSSLMEIFDPWQGYTGVWTSYSEEGVASLARAHAPAAILSDGVLSAGGTDVTDAPLASAVQLVVGDSPTATALTAQLAAARAGHTVTRILDGGAALVYGGAAADDPVAELYSTSSTAFTSLALDPVLMRTAHSATLLDDGSVAIVGGVDADGAPSGDVIVVASDGTATPYPAVLATARSGHTATLVGSTLLVAGGSGADGALDDAELIETSGFTATGTAALKGARSGHAAMTLASGTVLIAGGVDGDGVPLARLELYTPAQ